MNGLGLSAWLLLAPVGATTNAAAPSANALPDGGEDDASRAIALPRVDPVRDAQNAVRRARYALRKAEGGPGEADAKERLRAAKEALKAVGSSRVDLQACKLEYSIVSPK